MGLDLTGAVEAAARAQWDAVAPGSAGWDVVVELDPDLARRMREQVLPVVAAAAPVIARQAREQVAREIQRARRDHGADCGESPSGSGTWQAGSDHGVGHGLDLAARIAGGRS